jgi:hypothetical protein
VFDGATTEPPAHAEHIATAARAPAYFKKPVEFTICSFLSSTNAVISRAGRVFAKLCEVGLSIHPFLFPRSRDFMTGVLGNRSGPFSS